MQQRLYTTLQIYYASIKKKKKKDTVGMFGADGAWRRQTMIRIQVKHTVFILQPASLYQQMQLEKIVELYGARQHLEGWDKGLLS